MGRARQIARAENMDRILLDASAASTDEGEHLLLDASAASTDVGFFINTEVGTTETPPEGFVIESSLASNAVTNTKVADDAISVDKMDSISQSLSNRNVIINGAMNVAQRGTSTTGLGADADTIPTCDRWFHSVQNTDGRFTMTQDSSAPSGFANSIKLACTTADTSIAAAEVLLLRQKLEGQDLQMFAKGTGDAKSYALSFYVKGNANATYVAELMDNDNSNRHVNKTFSVTTDWTRVELSFPADTTGALDDDNANSLDLNIWLHAGSNRTSGSLQTTWGALAQANRCVGISSFFSSTDNTFFLTGVQLEVGQNATEFEHEPFERTLTKCQRYYQRIETNDGAPNYNGHVNAAAGSVMVVPFIHQMRVPPTGITVTNVGSWGHVIYGDANVAANSILYGQASSKQIQLDVNSASGSFSSGEAISLYDAGANGVIEFTGAEL